LAFWGERYYYKMILCALIIRFIEDKFGLRLEAYANTENNAKDG
jgi:hypothetical protein